LATIVIKEQRAGGECEAFKGFLQLEKGFPRAMMPYFVRRNEECRRETLAIE